MPFLIIDVNARNTAIRRLRSIQETAGSNQLLHNYFRVLEQIFTNHINDDSHQRDLNTQLTRFRGMVMLTSNREILLRLESEIGKILIDIIQYTGVLFQIEYLRMFEILQAPTIPDYVTPLYRHPPPITDIALRTSEERDRFHDQYISMLRSLTALVRKTLMSHTPMSPDSRLEYMDQIDDLFTSARNYAGVDRNNDNFRTFVRTYYDWVIMFGTLFEDYIVFPPTYYMVAMRNIRS